MVLSNFDDSEEAIQSTQQNTSEPVSNELDLSSFIAAKIASATPEKNNQDEADELSDALDSAFENLTGESLSLDNSEDKDLEKDLNPEHLKSIEDIDDQDSIQS